MWVRKLLDDEDKIRYKIQYRTLWIPHCNSGIEAENILKKNNNNNKRNKH